MNPVPQHAAARTRIIPRPGLAGRVRDSLATGSLLITAGAGYGKTTLLREALGEGKLVGAWLACTPAERGSGALLFKVLGALRHAAPEVSAAFTERLSSAPGGQIDPQAATRELLAELDALLVDPIAIVIDDAEHLHGALGALALIEQMVRAGPGKLRPAVASRHQLDLRVAKARAAGTVAELGQADLAFSVEECAATLRASRDIEPTHDEVEATMTATEGWPLGIALIARTERAPPARAGDASVDLRSAEDIGAFLDEEVLGPLDPELRASVIDSGVARRLTPGVIKAIGLGEDFLERIERAGLLTRPPGGEPAAYHPLLRELLRDRLLTERSEEERRRLHVRIAPTAAASGETAEAIEHWLAAEAWRDAADALAGAGQILVVSSPDLVRGWLQRLPQEIAEEPAMLVLRAQLAREAGDHHATLELLDRAVKGYGSSSGDPGEWMARFGLAEALFLIGEFERTVAVADGFDAPEAAAAAPLAPGTAQVAANALAALGRFQESDRLAERAMRHPAGSPLVPIENIRRCWGVFPGQGPLDDLVELLKAGLAAAERSDPMNLRPYVIASLGLLEDERGHLERALARWSEITELCGGGLAPFMELGARCQMALLLAEAGDLQGAEMELARAAVPEAGWRGYAFEAARAAVAARRGDANETVEAAERALEVVRPGAVQFRYIATRQLATAVTAVGRQDRSRQTIEDGLELLDEILPGESGRYARAHLLALRAWLRSEAERQGALEDLLRCWEEAGAGLRFILRREWKRLSPVVWVALEEGALEPGPAVQSIADAVPTASALVPLVSHPVPAVRAAALGPAIASGNPEVLRRLPELTRDADEAVAAAARRAGMDPAEAAPPLEIRMLGGFSVGRGTSIATEHDWGRAAAAKLVRFLVIQRGSPIPEDAIFEALWPGLSVSGARRSLRVAASRARGVLDIPGSEKSAIEVAEGAYMLVLRPGDRVDSEEFEAAASAALASSGEHRLSLLQTARSLWRGEPLPQHRYDDWARPWHDALVDRYVAILGELATHHAAAGDHHAAIAVARELLELDPLDEAAHRSLIAAYARTGKRGQALRQYLACHRALVEGLGVEPSEETSSLHARILAGETI